MNRNNVPACLRDGRFSFWRDIRPPFTITGIGVLEEDSEEFQSLKASNSEFAKVKLSQLNEIFMLEYEAYLVYDIERCFGLVPTDHRLFSTAIARIPLSFPYGSREIQIYTWGNHKVASTFMKRLEFLHHPQSKKHFSPTKGNDPEEFHQLNSTSEGLFRLLVDRKKQEQEKGNSSGGGTSFKAFESMMTSSSPMTGGSASTKCGSPMTYFASPSTAMSSEEYDQSMREGSLRSHVARRSPLSRYCRISDGSSPISNFNLTARHSRKDTPKRDRSPLTRKILNSTFFSATGHNYQNLQQSPFYNTTTGSFLGEKRSPRTFYRDPDLHGNVMHATKMMQTDAKPFYSIKI